MKIPILRIPFTEEEIKSIKEDVEKILRSGYLTMSRNVEEFEEKFAKFIGVKYAIGVNSGTASIEIILRAIGVEGKTVIVPSNTYMATPIAVVHSGGRVVFVECQRENLQMDPDDLEKKIRPDTAAVILVHIGGIVSPHLKRIKEICKKNKLFLIEDAAHAHGAAIDDKMAGSLGLGGSFSFYPTKVMTTAEGGMITTNNKDLYEKAKILREHGKADHNFNVHTEFGYNWRFSELHAVLGLKQLEKIGWILSERRRIAKLYDNGLKDVKKIKLVKIPANVKSSYYKYIVYLNNDINRDRLKEQLKNRYEIILPGEVYSDPCHSQPVFRRYPNTVANKKSDKFPETEYVCKHHLCLPLYPGLSDDEVNYIISLFRRELK